MTLLSIPTQFADLLVIGGIVVGNVQIDGGRKSCKS
jgi:hypothetical protein